MSKAIIPMECYRALSKNKDLAQGIQKGKTCYAVLMDPYSAFLLMEAGEPVEKNG